MEEIFWTQKYRIGPLRPAWAITPNRSSASCVGPSYHIRPLPGFRISLSCLVLWPQGSSCGQLRPGSCLESQAGPRDFPAHTEKQWDFKEALMCLAACSQWRPVGASAFAGAGSPPGTQNPGRLHWERGIPAPNHQGSLPAGCLCLSHLCLPDLSSNIRSVPRTHVYTDLRE